MSSHEEGIVLVFFRSTKYAQIYNQSAGCGSNNKGGGPQNPHAKSQEVHVIEN